jgi:hypothetical protein
MECRLERTIEFGDLGARLGAEEILQFHVRDGLLVDGKIATDHLRPLGPIAGSRYATLCEVINVAPCIMDRVGTTDRHNVRARMPTFNVCTPLCSRWVHRHRDNAPAPAACLDPATRFLSALLAERVLEDKSFTRSGCDPSAEVTGR